MAGLRPPAVNVATNIRERILLMGGPNMGKTYDALTIARKAMATGSDAHFHYIDTDEAVGRVLVDPAFKSLWNEDMTLPNVTIYSVTHWDELLDRLDTIQGKLVEGRFVTKGLMRDQDWLIIDMLSPTWQWCQDWYVHRVFNAGLDDFFLQQRQAMKADDKKMKGLEGWKDYCVDSETEIMTKRGWLSVSELQVGDEAYVLTPDFTSRFEPVLEVYVGEDREREMVSIESKSHSSLTTPDHRWLTHRVDRRSVREEWVTSSTFDLKSRIPDAAPRSDAPTVAKWDDAFVSVVAWYWNEGWENKRNRPSPSGGVAQSVRVNPQYVDEIREALTQAFGTEGWTECPLRSDGVQTFRLNAFAMKQIKEVVPDKMPTYEFLANLTEEQAKNVVRICIVGDGHESANGGQWWNQKSKEGVDRFMFVSALTGQATRAHVRVGATNFAPTHEIFEIAMIRSGGFWPRNNGDRYLKKVRHQGIVWCPVTPSGTWLARRKGTIYFTGNTVINPQYSKLQDRILRAPGNVICTSEVKAINSEQADKDTKLMFGPHGVQPVGQKRTPHMFSTILWKTSTIPGVREMITIKDRARVEVYGQVVNDFADDYLVSVAGWQTGKTPEEAMAEAKAKAALKKAAAKTSSPAPVDETTASEAVA